MNEGVSLVNYLYLDVVGFTNRRTVESQNDIIKELNDLVFKSTKRICPESEHIFIPVGDGICICIMKELPEYDSIIRLSEDLLNSVFKYSSGATKERKFEIRIGINHNYDNIIKDINDNYNVCGAGVNHTQRIMNFGDESQILVSQSTYEILKYREKYSKAFKEYQAKTKHNLEIGIYQYVGGECPVLNRDIPSCFKANGELSVITQFEAHYMSLALRQKEFIVQKLKESPLNDVILVNTLYVLARDNLNISRQMTRIQEPLIFMPKTENNTFEEQYSLIEKIPFTLLLLFRESCLELRRHRSCYTVDMVAPLVLNQIGESRLKMEQPEIATKYGLL
jgi:hypothetical protein